MTLERWLSCILMPLVTGGLNLLCWHAVVRQGWNAVMPLLSRYVIFAAVSCLVLVPFSLLGMFPGNPQSLACRVYSSGSWAFSVVYPFLEFAVLLELAKHMLKQSKDDRRSFTLFMTSALLGLIILSAGIVVTSQGVPGYGRLGNSLVVVSRATYLLVVVAAPVLYAVKRALSLALETNLAAIAAAIGLYNLSDLVISFARQGKEAESGDWALRAMGMAFMVAMYVALTRGPRLASAAASE